MDSDNLIETLREMGFEGVNEHTEPKNLGDKQYMVAIAGGKRMVTIGRGQAGDEGCQTVFYFTLHSGKFLMFGSTNESESDD